MQEIINKEEAQTGFKISSLSLEERQKWVGAFAWLFQEDKKQNPAFYQLNKQEND